MRNLTLSLVAVVLIATIGLGWMFDGIYNQYLNESAAQSPQETNGQQSVVDTLEQVGTHLSIALSGIDNRQEFIKQWPNEGPLSLRLKPLQNFPLPQALLSELVAGQPLLLETDDSIAMHFYLPATDELLVLITPPTAIHQNNSFLPILLTSLFYLAVLLLMLLWLYPLMRRLMTLRQTAKSFGEGNLNQRIDVGSISYIRDLELEFNRMAQRIDDLVTDIKLLSSAVSHDLRTPLARIRFGIDTIQEEDDPIMRKRFEQRISDNVDEMVDLVESLLSYARLDQTLITINKAPVDFTALTATCIKNKSQDDVQLTFHAPEQAVYVNGDLSYLMILMSNLLQNAHQYCKGKIAVEIMTQGNDIVVTVADNGTGIPVGQREQVLKPFIRGENTEKKVKGYGMGLAIVKRIIEWHHGEITIENSAELHGAQFSVTLPKAIMD
ncbi:HAMP domain-containing sensor histidine kinase [Colwellia psychrerythraea]|uniref:histidine kinase n=1 Tax=Colwellia psychrerythraea TaxID=28229 RepID=A0A099KLV2_COLPS|nr:ATP-binding protein [Colwellia psychrerythraea]KGJ91441.1 integral membrane sensor signal transduction histidine kinase [Colwellia psychrerythraea]